MDFLKHIVYAILLVWLMCGAGGFLQRGYDWSVTNAMRFHQKPMDLEHEHPICGPNAVASPAVH